MAGLLLMVAVAGCTQGRPPTSAPTPVAPAPASSASAGPVSLRLQTYPVPAGAGPHDVAPAADGGVWFTAQHSGYLGHLDPASGQVTRVMLGSGARPHGVIVGADGAAWVTDGGLNAIVRVDGASRAVRTYPLPANRPNANLNTATFDRRGILWFTGQNGVYGRLDPGSGEMRVFEAPGGRGPYGIATTASGEVYYASLAGSHIARIDTATGAAMQLRPPTAGQGARRVWPDSAGRVWVSEWNAGQLGRYDPAAQQWREWKLPGERPQAYAVYVDERDAVWVSEFTADTIVRFDPATEQFTSVQLPNGAGSPRQFLGRPGEVWGSSSDRDLIFVVRTVPATGQ